MLEYLDLSIAGTNAYNSHNTLFKLIVNSRLQCQDARTHPINRWVGQLKRVLGDALAQGLPAYPTTVILIALEAPR